MRADQLSLFRRLLRSSGARRLLLTFLPLLFLEGLRLLWGETFGILGLLSRWGFIFAVLLLARAGRVHHVGGRRYVWPWPGVATLLLTVVAAVVTWSFDSTPAAWIGLGAWFAFLLQVGETFVTEPSRLLRIGMYLLLALAAAGLPIAFGQLQGRFSDEEFFIAVQAAAVGLFWLLLRLPFRYPVSRHAGETRRVAGLVLDSRWVAVCLVLVMGMTGLLALRGYQHSFYAESAPLYDQVSPESPFLCSNNGSSGAEVDGAAVFDRLLDAVAINPRKGPPEYGMLAIGAGEESWARAFREGLLEEAAAGRFSQAANSVKSTQYEAALRAYYVPLVRKAFPDLFTPADERLLADWFAAINRRALTVEWVDWMYAAALGRKPLGPYENQENGAGLLSVLIATGLEDPDLAEANREYLDENPRGWLARFRNTDDAFLYQPEWLTNAFFQAEYTGQPANLNRSLAFEWLLLQALPDGLAPKYNHPGQPSLAGPAYLAALELADPRFLWLADRALDAAAANGQAVYAQPGAERLIEGAGAWPDAGSCLLFGDSGLPTQVGPLAPDKVVFRDGWVADDPYLLLNLRFSGWHRYKATNAVTLLNIGTPVVSDFLQRQTIRWLPAGRSLLRDKRVPRENVSGLLIPEHGIRLALFALTGIGSRWAQDPPWQADVVDFQTGPAADSSHTRISGWQGWQHDRYIYFYHDGGPVIIADRANGPPGDQPQVAWHLHSELNRTLPGETWRVPLRTGSDPVEFVLVPVNGSGERGLFSVMPEGEGRLRVGYASPTGGKMEVVTLFLTGPWVGADVRVAGLAGGPVLSLTRPGADLQVSLFR